VREREAPSAEDWLRRLVDEINRVTTRLFLHTATAGTPRWREGLYYLCLYGERDAQRLLSLIQELRTWLEVYSERAGGAPPVARPAR